MDQLPQERIPLVSVCIPTYRGARHLGAAIRSVLAQTLSDFELLIIDDNSPDATASVVKSFSDARIRYLQNSTNLGPEGNWNRCIQESRGTYLKLLPQDDVLMPTCLERQIGVLVEDIDNRIALVFCARTIITANDRIAAVRGYPGAKEGVFGGGAIISRCVRFGTNLIGEPGGVTLRRKLALRVGSFDATDPYVIDLDYWFRLLEHGDAYYFAEPLASFRVSSGSWSIAIGRNQSKDFRNFVLRVSRKPGYKLGLYDITAGRVMAVVNNSLRLLFYRFAPK